MTELEHKKAMELISKFNLKPNSIVDKNLIKELLSEETKAILTTYLARVHNEIPFSKQPVMDQKGNLYLIDLYHTEYIEGLAVYTKVTAYDNKGKKCDLLVKDLVPYTEASKTLFKGKLNE